jgi:hypothetical protein
MKPKTKLRLSPKGMGKQNNVGKPSTDDSPHIQKQDYLSQYRQISILIYHILAVAQAGGLSEKRMKTIYTQVLDAYSEMKGEAFWLFRDEIIRLLVTPDSHFDSEEHKARPGLPRGRN